MKCNLLHVLIISVFPFCSCNAQFKEQEKESIYKNVLILGNSIVENPPAVEIGWDHNWGMAASARDSDFVHILSANIHKIDPAINIYWKSIATFENNYETYDLSQLTDYRNADMIIIKISENVKYEPGMDKNFISSYDNLMRFLAPSDSTIKIIVEGFWPTPVNGIIKDYALRNNYLFIPLADLYENDKSNAAIDLFENEGVGRHPSDKGMRNITSRIWGYIFKYFD